LSPEQDAAIARMVFNALDAGVMVQGPLGRIAAANPAAARILGVELDDIVGSDSSGLAGPLLHPDGMPMTAEELPSRVAVRTGQPQLDVLLGLPADDGDDQRWIEVSARPLSHRGQVFAVVLTLRDVTERHRAEEALRNAEHRQRVVLEHAVGGYAILDDRGRLVDGSTTLIDWWTGRLARQLSIGIDRMYADDRDAAWRVIEQAKSEPGRPRHCELRVVDDDGQVRWIDFTATDQREDPAVGGIVVNFTDITERKLADEALAHQALHDPVTGLPNRRLLSDRLELALARAERNGSRVGVLFFDVDHFKLINDSLGHPAGDVVLQELAGRFRGSARESDTVVRFGGDEFVIVCEELTDIAEARDVADRLTARVEEPFLIDQGERIVTVSAGVAISHAGDTPSSLLSDADAAMNVAKERGRARVETFNDEMRSQATRRFHLDNALRRVLDRDELHLVYQPVMSVVSGRPVGCEALLRWDHPELGMVPPAEFVPLAERSGLIVPIGAWVARRALEQLVEWDDGAGRATPLWVAINLSARQLGAPDLVGLVTEALEATGVEPGRLHLEVTESALIDDLATSVDRLGELKRLGVRIDVDDFGTGYSSLSYLKRLPLDTLKIDGSFVGGLGTDPHDTSIVRAIISLGHALDLELIAEGVEEAAQLAELDRLGCDMAQGFHWSRPLPPAEFHRRFGHN
jgi:diguanylate cyclase (GGDEF)-like protein/PAS domain S-box-containing protein